MKRIMMEVCFYCGSAEMYEGDTEYDGVEMRQIFEGSGCFRPLILIEAKDILLECKNNLFLLSFLFFEQAGRSKTPQLLN